MLPSRWKTYALIAGAVVLAVLLVGTIKIDVPPNLQGALVAQGHITHCDFQRIGRHGGEFFMGVTVDTPGTPILRFNAPNSKRGGYEAMCARKPAIRVTYHAVKRIFGPVRFWIDHVAEG